MMNIYEKIQKISNEIGNLKKDLEVGKGNYGYKAISDNAVILAVKKAETKYGLISIPLKQELIGSTIEKIIKGEKEYLQFIDNIKMTVRIIDISDPTQYLDIESYAKGLDSGDKGFGKASTYARKYALLNAYKIATGEDPDKDKSKDITRPKTLSEKKIILTDYFEKHNDKLRNILQYFNIPSWDELEEKEINTIYKTYKEKKLI